MSAIYDNWDRLVAAVLKKQQLWELFHQQSRSPSILSDSEAFDLSCSSFNFSELSDSEASDLSCSSFDSSELASHPSLVLVSDFSPRFDIKDAPRPSSVLLGKGTFGSAYTAAINFGPRIVVKSLKSATISDEDFRRCMGVVGDVRHENVVELRAYYSSQHQHLLMYDYYPKQSMFSLLHGQRDEVNWKTRLNIAIGAARGIAAIHRELGGTLVHGNIKASNVLLNQESYGCISDLGLASMIRATFDSSARCYAPEVKNTLNISHASDVYSFGILLLELLTRKSSVGPKAVDLVKLVSSVKSKERAAKVFDADLLKHPSINKQMIKVLEIGMQCVAKSIKKRPQMFKVVKMLEDIITSHSKKNRLVFVKETNPTFDLADLLRASAGLLANGNSYWARLENGNTYMVRLLKDVTIARRDFQQHMEVLGRMEHENVVKLRAYLFLRKELLLVYDYYDQGSVYTILHGKSGTNFEWGARLEIAIGAARGIAHIHCQKVVHGNVQSCNIFLNGIVSDIGLVELMDPISFARLLSQGYLAPEIKVTGDVSQASDVYSFGVVLLELLCGRPSQHTTDDGVLISLVKWVQAAVIDNLGFRRIFDVKCLKHDTEEAMKRVFEIAMDCVSNAPQHRPTMPQVVQMLVEISNIMSEQESLDREKLSFDKNLEYVLEYLLPTLTS